MTMVFSLLANKVEFPKPLANNNQLCCVSGYNFGHVHMMSMTHIMIEMKISYFCSANHQ